MEIENGELFHECCPQLLEMKPARIIEDKETENEGKQRSVNIGWSKEC